MEVCQTAEETNGARTSPDACPELTARHGGTAGCFDGELLMGGMMGLSNATSAFNAVNSTSAFNAANASQNYSNTSKKVA